MNLNSYYRFKSIEELKKIAESFDEYTIIYNNHTGLVISIAKKLENRISKLHSISETSATIMESDSFRLVYPWEIEEINVIFTDLSLFTKRFNCTNYEACVNFLKLKKPTGILWKDEQYYFPGQMCD